MSITATGTPPAIWSQATSALSSIPSSKSVPTHKPYEAGGAKMPQTGALAANPFQPLSTELQSTLVHMQAAGHQS